MLDAAIRRRQRIRNRVQAGLLAGAMIAVLAALALVVLGSWGLWLVLALGVVLLLVRPAVPVAWALSLSGATPLPSSAAPLLHRYVRLLAHRAGLPRPPAVYYVPSRLTNAFSVGTAEESALAVSDGLLRRLTEREVVGVLAHEISHIRSGDTTIMNLSDVIGRLAQALSYLGIVSLLLAVPLAQGGGPRMLLVPLLLVALPTIVTLLQLALSRAREYDADLQAADLTGDPQGLASALATLERADGRLWERRMVSSRRLPDPLVLRTHPPTEHRVRRLLALLPRRRGPLGGDRPAALHYPVVTAAPRLRSTGARW
jgi:heat shock protein HtpX